MRGDGQGEGPICHIHGPDQHGSDDFILRGLIGRERAFDPRAIALDHGALGLDLALHAFDAAQFVEIDAERGEEELVLAGSRAIGGHRGRTSGGSAGAGGKAGKNALAMGEGRAEGHGAAPVEW